MNDENSPSILEQVAANQQKINNQIKEDHVLIAKSRAGIADADAHFAASYDRLAESQKLVRRE